MSDVRIIRFQAEFHTGGDDKDRNNGISERYFQGSTILAENRSWGADLIYRNHSVNDGQAFDVNLPYADCSKMSYNYRMDNGDGWQVTFKVFATLSDGRKVQVAEQSVRTHSGHKEGTINFSTC